MEVPLLSALAFYLDDRNISPDMLLNSKISGDYIILDSVIFQNKNISWKKTISVVILPEEKIKPIKGYGIKNLVNIIVKK